MIYKRPGRRKLLKSIVAGGGAIVGGKSLPESWSEPVIKSLVLPAHAMTSAPDQTMNSEVECCLAENTFCHTVPDSSTALFITVTKDGSVDILITNSAGNWVATTSVPCFGGDFEVTANRAPNPSDITFDITGTITCGQTSVLGTQGFPDFEELSDYTATIDECDI